MLGKVFWFWLSGEPRAFLVTSLALGGDSFAIMSKSLGSVLVLSSMGFLRGGS